MISLATVLGLASLGIAADAVFDVLDGEDRSDLDDLAEQDGHFLDGEETLLDYAARGMADDAADGPPAGPAIELNRGAVIEGFDAQHDGIEIEYHAALPPPEITVIHAADGASTDICFDGVVVATVSGAESLTASDVKLVPS